VKARANWVPKTGKKKKRKRNLKVGGEIKKGTKGPIKLGGGEKKAWQTMLEYSKKKWVKKLKNMGGNRTPA